MATISWASAVSGDWTTGADWVGSVAPNSATADAAISVGGSYTVTIATGESFTVNSLTVSSGSAILALNGTLTLGGTLAALNANSGTINLAGTIAGGTVTVNGAVLNDTGGKLTGALAIGSGSVDIASGQTLTISTLGVTGGEILGPGTLATTGTSTLGGSVVEIDGGLVWVNSGTVNDGDRIIFGFPSGTGADVFTNKAGGVFTITGDGLALQRNGSSTPTFINSGTLAKNGGTGTSQVQVAITSTGRINVATGTLELDNGGSFGGTIGGAGTLAFAGGTATINSGASITVAALLVEGGTLAFGANATAPTVVLSSGSVTVASGATASVASLTVSGGEILGPGTLATTGTSTLSGSTFGFDGGLVWLNSGTVNDGDRIIFGFPSGTGSDAFINNTGAVFNITTDGLMLQRFSSSTPTFTNSGTLAKNGGTGTSQVQVAITSTGRINVATGTLELDNGGSFGGTIGGAGTLAFAGGTGTINSGASITVAALLVEGGTLAFGANATAPTVVLSSGSVTVASGATASVASLTVSGGEILGPGTLATTGTSTLSGSSFGFDGGLVWLNSGTVNDGDRIVFGFPSGTGSDTFINNPGAVFNITTDGLMLQRFSSSTPTFTNSGTLAKNGGTGTSQVQVAITSTRLINVATGTLELDNGGSLGGTISGAGTLAFAGGTGTINSGATVTVAALLVDNGTLAFGANTTAPSVAMSSGTVSVASGVTASVANLNLSGGELFGPGTLATTGVGTISSPVGIDGGLVWVNSGTINDGARLDFGFPSGTGTLGVTNKVGAVFNLTTNGLLLQRNGSSTATFTNAGTLASNSGSNTTNVQLTLANTGVLNVATGTLELDNGGSLGGTIGGGGVLAFANGSATLSGAIVSVGTVLVDNGTLTVGANETVPSLAVSSGTFGVASGATASVASLAASGGEIVGPGTLKTTGASTVSSPIGVDGSLAWVNTGTVNDGARITFGFPSATGAPAVTNIAGGVFNITADGLMLQRFSSSTPTFTNSGTLAKNGGSLTSNVQIGVTDASTGTITASTGTLEFDGTSDNIDGAVGGSGSGVVLFTNGASITTTGTASILDAAGSADLVIGSSATWTDNGVIRANGLLQIGNGGGSSVVTIASAGVLRFISDDGGIVSGGNGTFVNAGVVAKTVGSGTSTIGMAFTNTGTVNAASGTLKLANNVGGSGTLEIQANQTLELASGAVAGTNTIAFEGLGAVLKIDTNSTVSTPMQGFGAGSRIDLAAAASVSAVISGATLAITPSGGSELDFVGTGSIFGLHIGTISDGGGGSIVTLYNPATPSAHTPEPVSFGNVHVGASVSKKLSISNISPANIYTENLDGTLSTAAAGFTAAGSFTGLAGGATNNTAMTVTLKTASTGIKNGTAVIALSSDGTGVDGLGTSPLPTQTVNVSGAVYSLAAPILSASTIALGAVRVGGSALSGGITLKDGSAVNAFQERLVYHLANPVPPGFAVSNVGGTVASGNSVVVGVTLSAATAGDFTNTALAAGAAGVSFKSTGVGTSGLADTVLANPTLTVSGKVFATATASASGTIVDFGVVHTGDVVNLKTISVANTATGALTDLLTLGTVSETGSYTGAVTPSFGGGVAAGASGTVTFGLVTSSTGAQSGTVDLPLFSHDTALTDVTLPVVPITVTGTVDNFATAALKVLSGPTISGSGTGEVINFGTFQQSGGTAAVTIDVMNAATALADTLSGSFDVLGVSGFSNGGFASFSGVAAGATSANDSVVLSFANAGTFSESVTLHASSDNGSSSTPLAVQVITIKGLVTPVYNLTPSPTTIVATQNLDLFNAPDGALNSQDALTGGPGGGNTLALIGGGVFDLGAPKTLSAIQILKASEGQAAFVNGGTTIANTAQVVFLRSGLNMTVNVASIAPNAANPNPDGITIYGAADSSVINLGSHNATVVLGSATETVNGGGGTALVQTKPAFAGAKVVGAALGTTTLEFTNGGTMTLNATDTRLTVKLDAASNLHLDALGFINAIGQVAGNTITAGGTNQTLGGLAGGDHLAGFSGFGDVFLGTAAGLNGDTISGFGGAGALADKFDITDLLPAASIGYVGNASQGTLTLNDGTHSTSMTMVGNFNQSGFHIVTDGHTGSFVTFT